MSRRNPKGPQCNDVALRQIEGPDQLPEEGGHPRIRGSPLLKESRFEGGREFCRSCIIQIAMISTSLSEATTGGALDLVRCASGDFCRGQL